jgi:hypothetical protein
MSLEELCKTHSCDVYPLTQTKGDMMGVVEALGTKTGTYDCRAYPMSRREAVKFDQNVENEMTQFMFSADVSLTNRNVIVWDSKVWRVREYRNMSGMGWLWKAWCEHTPNVALPTS